MIPIGPLKSVFFLKIHVTRLYETTESMSLTQLSLQIKRGSTVGEKDHRRKEGRDQKDQPQQPGRS